MDKDEICNLLFAKPPIPAKCLMQLPQQDLLKKYTDLQEHGLYAIFVDEPESLPAQCQAELRQRDEDISKPILLYIGKTAKQSLYRRLIKKELRGRKTPAFFLSIGILLGYIPDANREFSADEHRKIAQWNSDYLSVCWAKLPDEDIDKKEKDLIQLKHPPVNIRHNEDHCFSGLGDRKRS